MKTEIKTACKGLAIWGGFALSLYTTNALAQANLFSADELKRLLPQKVQKYQLREIFAGNNSKRAISEAVVAFSQPGLGAHVRIHIADLGNSPEIYDVFVATAGIVQADVSRAVDALSKRDGNITVKKVNSEWGDKTLKDLGIGEARPHRTGSRPLARSGVGDRSLSVKEAIEQWSVYPNGQILERFPDVPLGRLRSVSRTAFALEHEGYGLGIDFSPALRRANGTGNFFFLAEQSMEVGRFTIGLTEETYDDGAYARLYRDAKRDIAGWEVFQPDGNFGLLILGVGGRFGILVEGAGIKSTDTLKEFLSRTNLDSLEKLARTK